MKNNLKHIAIIMDGNGRWAKERNRPRAWGHVRGSLRVSEIVQSATKMGLDSLTLYAFSTENWSRPSDEINSIFRILKKFLKKEKKSILKNNIRFNVIGDYKVLDAAVVELIEDLKTSSHKNTGLSLNIAINYGGRAEIVNAVNAFLEMDSKREISESDISKHLYTENIADIDLLIRTSGDQRISNFLLWQVCYSELFFTNTKWPDFKADEFEKIVEQVATRDRRFGSIAHDSNLESIQEVAQTNLKVLS